MVELHETNASFHQPPRQQALPAENVGRGLIDSVEAPGRVALPAQIECFRSLALHAKSQLERFDPRAQPAVKRPAREIDLVEPPQRVELGSLPILAHMMILEVVNRVAQIRDKSSLIRGWKKRGAVLPCPLDERPRTDRDEAGEVLILGSEAVGHPCAQARPRGHPLAGVHEQAAAGVVDVIPDHRANHAQGIGTGGDVGKKLAHIQARLAVLAKFPGRSQQLSGLAEVGLRRRLAVVSSESRLGVERVNLRRAARHEKEDDPASAGPLVRRSG